jgi:hypothetical protein
LLGQALKIEHQINPLEREILAHVKGRSAVSELMGTFCNRGASEQSVLDAVRSLCRRQLVRIESNLASMQ